MGVLGALNISDDDESFDLDIWSEEGDDIIDMSDPRMNFNIEHMKADELAAIANRIPPESVEKFVVEYLGFTRRELLTAMRENRRDLKQVAYQALQTWNNRKKDEPSYEVRAHLANILLTAARAGLLPREVVDLILGSQGEAFARIRQLSFFHVYL